MSVVTFDPVAASAAPGPARRKLIVDIDSTAWALLEAMDRIHTHGDVTRPGAGTITYQTVETWDDLIPRSGGLSAMLSLFNRSFCIESMRAIGLFPGFIEAMRTFSDAGADICLWSDRDERFEHETEQFMREEGVPFESLIVTSPFDKVEMALELGITTIIDDKPATLEAACEAGLSAFTLAYRYNADVIKKYGIAHATSWPDLAKMVLASFR